MKTFSSHLALFGTVLISVLTLPVLRADTTTAIQGRWTGPCTNFSGGWNNYLQEGLVLQDNTIEFRDTRFSDSDCAQAESGYVALGRFSVIDERPLGDGRAIELTVILDQSEETLYTAEQAEQASLRKDCGITDWPINETVDVSSCPDEYDDIGEEFSMFFLLLDDQLAYSDVDSDDASFSSLTLEDFDTEWQLSRSTH